MNPELTHEQQQIFDSVRTLAQKEFAPNAASVDKNLTPPTNNIEQLARNGFIGIYIPEEYGGSGLGTLEQVLITQAVGQACANTAMLLSCTDGATTRTILQLGTEEQRKKYLPLLATGKYLAAWSMSESDAGSDVGNIKCKAKKTGSSYTLNGSKLWCTGAQVANLFLVWVRLSDEAGMNGVGAVLVDRDTPGFSIGAHLDLIGLRGTGMAELVFEDCIVPEENLIVAAGGIKKLLHALDFDRVAGNPPISLGLAEAATELIVKHLNERVQFNKRLGTFQGIQWKLADMLIALEASRALLYRAAARLDAGIGTQSDVSMTKVFVNEAAIRITSDAMHLAGAYGLSCEYAYERFFRDARGMAVGYGTPEIHRNSIARSKLGK